MPKVILRLGEKEDIEQLTNSFAIPLAKKMSEVVGFTVDEEGIQSFVSDFCNNPLFKPLLAVDNDKIVGALFLYRRKIFYIKESIVTDHGLMVLPEYRNKLGKGNIAVRLVTWAIQTARNNNSVYIPSNSTGDPSADLLYRDLGGTYLGGFWVFR